MANGTETEVDREKLIKKGILNHGGNTPWNRGEAAEQLGVMSEDISLMVESGMLLGLETEDGLQIPTWQFTLGGKLVIPDVPFLAKATEDPWGIAGILTKAQPGLDGQTPINNYRTADTENIQRTRRFMLATISDLYGLD